MNISKRIEYDTKELVKEINYILLTPGMKLEHILVIHDEKMNPVNIDILAKKEES